MKKMRVGITGGTGFIGKYLIRDHGDEIDFVAPVIEKPIDFSKAEYLFSDYSVNDLRNIFEGCDAVIHLAAKVAKRNNILMPMDEYINNTVVTANVFEACKQNNIKKIIHASSRSVFNWTNSEITKINEDISPDPQNAYGVSKYCDEVLAAFYNDVHEMNIISFRMAEVCGIDLQRGMINAFWINALKSCLENKAIPIYGKGDAGRDLLYVKDAVRAFIMGLYQDEKKGVYNIGTGQLVTNREIANEFCKIFHNEEGIIFYPEKEEWGTNGVLEVQKAQNDLGFIAKYNLSDIIKDIKREYDAGVEQFG